MKIVKNKEMWLFHWCNKFQLDISSRVWVKVIRKVENRTHLDYFQYSKSIFLSNQTQKFHFYVLQLTSLLRATRP